MTRETWISVLIGVAISGVGLILALLIDYITFFWGTVIVGIPISIILYFVFNDKEWLGGYYWIIPGVISIVLFFLYGYNFAVINSPFPHSSLRIIQNFHTLTPAPSSTPYPTYTPIATCEPCIEETETPSVAEELTDTPTPPDTPTPTHIPDELKNILEIIPEAYKKLVSQEQVTKIYFSDFFSVGDWELGTVSTQVNSHISNSIFEYTLTCPGNIEICRQEQPFPAYINAKNFILYFKARVNDDKTFLSESDYAFYGVKFRIVEQKSGNWIESYWVTYNLKKQYRPILINESIELIELFDGSRLNSHEYPISEHFKKYDVWNEYLIVAGDSGFDLYVNGNLLDSISDTNIDDSGYFHFCFQVNKNQTLSVNIDNYVLWILPGEEQQ